MTSFVSPNPPSPTSPSLIETDQDSKGRSPAPRSGVGESRLSRRIKFLASVLYWSVRHRSISRGRWVAHYSNTKL